MMISNHKNLALHDLTSPYLAFKPPKRVSVSEGASQSLFIRQPGGYVGNWSPDDTPYMIEPMNMLASRTHESVCLVAPARTGKTMGLVDGWVARNITCDPGDMLIVQMTQDKAREYSKTRINRAIQNSPHLKALQTTRANDDNTHDKLFKNGMFLKIGWVSASQLSSSDYRYVAITDYDRMPDDVDGEGSVYDLAKKRTTTFMSRGKTAVESSPGRPITDPHFEPSTPHEAPPVSGILGIYNRGDRRRWYWQCLECGDFFEAKPGLSLFNLPPDQDLLNIVREGDLLKIAKQHSKVVCPCCASIIDERHKFQMNKSGIWLPDGASIDSNRVISGETIKSSIASFWLGGVAAAYQSWNSLVLRQLQGLREYALSGSELSLQVTANTDQGIPYISRLLIDSLENSGDPKNRCEDFERYIVPRDARFLVASVDVQGGTNAKFVVQVHAIGVDLEQWVVDRYNIEVSERVGMGSEFAPIDPASYAEDWDLLTKHLVNATYKTHENGKELRIKMIAVDTGGEHHKKSFRDKKAEGVSEKAYSWYRRLRLKGMHGRVMLIKGASTVTAPIIRESFVGGQTKGVAGDIPLYLLNTNQLKDRVSTAIRRKEFGASYIHFPKWLPQSFFDELNAEVRQPNGLWSKVKKRNEAFDLSCYIVACCLRLGADKILNWSLPPNWAQVLSLNSEVVTTEQRRIMQSGNNNSALPTRSARRVNRSGYLG